MYVKSEEFQAALVEKVKNDEKLNLYLTANTDDSILMEEYQIYTKECERQKKKEEKQKEVQRKKKALEAARERKISDFCEYLSRVDFEGKIREASEEITAHLQKCIEIYLTEKPLYSIEYTGYNCFSYQLQCEEIPLTFENLEQFVTDFLEKLEDEERILEISDYDVNWMDDLLYAAVCKTDETMKHFIEDEDTEISDSIQNELTDIINDYGYESMKKVRDYFTEDKIYELIFQNPEYSDFPAKITEREKRHTEMFEAMLERIPDQCRELYPAARRMKRHFLLHIGPTNSGKTHDALEAFRKAENAVYLAPLRLLAFEVFEDTNKHGVPCSIKTGEEETETNGAVHWAQTIETVDFGQYYDVAVIDEAQMLGDKQRGGAWTAAILGLKAEEIHICAAAHVQKILINLIEYCGDEYEIVKTERKTPLEIEETPFNFPDSVRAGDALIVFSKRSVLACAAELQSNHIPCSIIYGALPYDVRRNETDKFVNGETKVVVATDAIGMGLNLPVRRVVFLETEKFDGIKRRLLYADEIQQIAGRAGRKGIFEKGFCNALAGKKLIRKGLESEISAIKELWLDFPESLIGVHGRLSEIMAKWSEMESEPMFVKADMEQELILCKELEKWTEDKKLIYDFITIPFNERNRDVKKLWLDIFGKVAEGNEPEWKKYQFQISGSFLAGCTDHDKLDILETIYEEYDLLYFCIDRFGENTRKQAEKETVTKKKKEISQEITKILSKQGLSKRRCRECGRVLSWNYPYRICQRCYDSRQYI